MIETQIQKRFADVDMLGHVNNVNMQQYYDLGKSDYFSKVLGLSEGLLQRAGVIIAQLSTSYIQQVFMTEPIVVQTEAIKVGNKSFTISQRIVNSATGDIKSECTTVMVVFDFVEQKSCAIPDDWRQKLNSELASA